MAAPYPYGRAFLFPGRVESCIYYWVNTNFETCAFLTGILVLKDNKTVSKFNDRSVALALRQPRACKEVAMFSRFTEYFTRDDERFISTLHKPDQRSEHLARLERWRSSYALLFLVFAALALIEVLSDDIPASTIGILIGTAIVYLDSDIKIKMIKLIQADRTAADTTPKFSGTP